MTAEVLARAGGPLAAAGLGLLILSPRRDFRLVGLAAWGVGMALCLNLLAPEGSAERLVIAGPSGVVIAVALAIVFRRWPWAVAVLALAAVPARIPVTVGDTSANLLVPLYAVVAGAALALAWSLYRDAPRERELGIVAWPMALVVAWFALTSVWTDSAEQAAIVLSFFVLPFALLAVVLSRLPWDRRALIGLTGLLGGMAVLFAAVGIWQWAARDIFWNPKVIVGNIYGSFFRVNSLFWDPSIYGRFLVVAILVVLAIVLLRVRPRWDLWLAAGILLVWVGLLFSFSQSSFAALMAGILVLAILAWRWRTVAAVALAGAAIASVGFTWPMIGGLEPPVVAGESSGLDRATAGRAQLVENGIRVAVEHPIVGVGVGGFEDAYAARLGLNRAPPSAASHTTPVTVAAETGVVGLVLFAWLVAAGIVVAFRRNVTDRSFAARTGLILGVAFLAIFVHSNFYNAFFEDPMTWGLLALAALAAGQAREAIA